MRVLQLISSIGFFGAENAMRELSETLSRQGYQIHIGIIGNPHNSCPKIPGAKVFCCRGKFDLRAIFQIRSYIKNNAIEIIHSHNYKSNLYAYFATLLTGTRKISTCHNWLSNSNKMKIYEFIDKILLKKFDKVITVSQTLENELLTNGVKKDKIEVIHNGIDVARFRNVHDIESIRRTFAIKEGEKIIGTVGRLSPEKGHIYLIRAFKNVIVDFPNLKLLIVGDGALRRGLESEAKKLGLEAKVIFTGIREDIPRMLEIMDIFVLPSLVEAMPMSLLEAMAAKKVIIATRVGGVPQIIEDGVTGLLIEPGNIDSIADSIKMLLRDKEKARFIAENAYEKAKNEFSSVKMAEKYLKVYESILNKKDANIFQIEIAGKGGICHYTYNLSQGLSKSTKVTLITGIDYELKNRERNFELKGIFNRFRTNPLSILKLINTFKDNEGNVAHFQLSQHPVFVLFLCLIAKKFGKSKIIITSHNVLSHEQKRLEAGVYRKLYFLADRIIVHAQANKEELQRNFPISSEKIYVIPHGNYLFLNGADRQETVPKNGFNILFFGYIRKYKGLIYIIRSLKLIKEQIPQARLFIVGKPIEDFREYEKEISGLGLNNDVEINLGYVPPERIKEYFYKANVVALPYLNIYQSGVLQLAYAFGRPVVATNVGGLQESVEDGKSGFLVPPKDVESLSEKIVTILNNRELQQKMGDYALHLAKTKFSWDNIASQTSELYKSVLD